MLSEVVRVSPFANDRIAPFNSVLSAAENFEAVAVSDQPPATPHLSVI